jgi:hypothetical protein
MSRTLEIHERKRIEKTACYSYQVIEEMRGSTYLYGEKYKISTNIFKTHHYKVNLFQNHSTNTSKFSQGYLKCRKLAIKDCLNTN